MATSDKTREDKKDEKKKSLGKLTAQFVVDEFNSHWKYVTGTYHPRWQDAWKITNNQRINYGYEGTADTFIPLTFSIIEAAKANVIGGRPKITFLPTTDDQQDADIQKLNATIMYVWEKGYYQPRVADWVDQSLTYGTGILMVTWDTELDMPVPRLVPIKDFWIDPSATSIEMAEREGLACGYRYLTTKEALKKRKVVNPDFDDNRHEGGKNQRLLNLYNHAAIDKAGNADATGTDATDKNMWQGSTLGDKAAENQVEIIVRYRNGRKIEVINRKEIVLEQDSEIEDMYPFAVLYDFKDPSLFYGRGHVDILKQRQEELNDVDNQDTDNMSFQLDSVKWVDPTYAHLIPQIVAGPGVVIPIPGDKLGELPKPGYNPKAKEKRDEIKDDMREAVGAGEIIQGVAAQQGKTATEINAQQLNAGKRFDVLIQQMETYGFQRLAKLMFKFIQKYADKEMLVRVVGNKGVRFEKFLKEQYQGEWDPRIQLDASAKTEQAKSAQIMAQMFETYAANPLVNLLELSKLDMRKQYGLDDTEIELLLSNPGQPGEAQPSDGTQAPQMAMQGTPGAAPAMPMQNGPTLGVTPQAPAPDPNAGGLTGDVKESADLVKLYVAAATAGDHQLMDQIVEKLGFQPSAELPVGIKSKAVQAADTHIKAGLAVQDQQHRHEQALLDKAMSIQAHQKQMEAPQTEEVAA